MASFIQFLQVNQHFKSMTPYGGIAPLGNSKWWFGEPDQDPKIYPQEVFIIDTDGNREILPQPVFTDGIGNFVIEKSEIATPIYPQINKESYSIYVEVDVDGYNVIYERKRVKGETELSSNVQFKADLIDITDTKSGDDLEHNAATAKSVIESISTTVNDLVRKTDLSDSIDSQSIDVAANSKAAYDLHELIKSSELKISGNTKNIGTNTTDISSTLKIANEASTRSTNNEKKLDNFYYGGWGVDDDDTATDILLPEGWTMINHGVGEFTITHNLSIKPERHIVTLLNPSWSDDGREMFYFKQSILTDNSFNIRSYQFNTKDGWVEISKIFKVFTFMMTVFIVGDDKTNTVKVTPKAGN